MLLLGWGQFSGRGCSERRRSRSSTQFLYLVSFVLCFAGAEAAEAATERSARGRPNAAPDHEGFEASRAMLWGTGRGKGIVGSRL